MDLIKEIILTLSDADKKEFEQFLSRKRPGAIRKDVKIFRDLFSLHNNTNKSKNELKGDQNYHAIRKRISKALTNFVILKKSIEEQKENKRDGMVLLVSYFIERNKFEAAWDLLNKEEKNAEKVNNIELNLKIQRLKLSILPYFNQELFPSIKTKMLDLQAKQSKLDEFQLYFIEIKNDLKLKIAEGSVESPTHIIRNALNRYKNLKTEYNNPIIHLKVIEIIRAAYIINRRFKIFAEVVQKYYDEFSKEAFENSSDINTFAQIEYIMSYTFLNTRNFKKSEEHLEKLSRLMSQSELVKLNFQGKHMAIKSFIQVFQLKINEAIASSEEFLEREQNKISIKEYLNLSLNLSGYLITVGDYSKAIKILNFMSESDNYYQKNMGREWLVRKDMILAIVQTSLGNAELSLRIINSLEKKHGDMLKTEQYRMVEPFIRLFKNYIKNPQVVNQEDLSTFEEKIKLKKDRVFRDPRLIIFYAWMRSRYAKKDAYDILMEEYEKIA